MAWQRICSYATDGSFTHYSFDLTKGYCQYQQADSDIENYWSDTYSVTSNTLWPYQLKKTSVLKVSTYISSMIRNIIVDFYV